MIEAQQLSKRYRDLVAVDQISFSVPAGQVVGFLGPNGAGKSTTMRMLTGFMPPSGGRAIVAGCDVVEQPMELRRRIGYLPERPPVYGELTVAEYLRFVAGLKGLRGGRLRDEVARVIDLVALHSVAERLIRTLSKGFQQRAGLAQALLGQPELLILDEPTVGLDPRQIGEVRELIKNLAGKHTVLLSTHILQEVVATCERAIVIHHGRIVADDSLQALMARSAGDGQAASLEKTFLALTAE